MSFTSSLKGAGSALLGLAIMAGLIAIGFGLLTGAAEFSLWVLKWTFPAFSITLVISIVLLTPLSLIPPARGFAAIGFVIASQICGVILWLWGMAYTYTVWGMFGVIVGLVFLGVGVVPVALFAALLHGDWSNLGMFLFAVVITFGFRILANWLGEKADERAARLHRSEIIIPAHRIED